jgi:hypothetical protein
MPVAVVGNNPLIYEYYKVADSTYVGNPAFNLAAKVFRPPTVTDFIAALPMYNGEAVEE